MITKAELDSYFSAQVRTFRNKEGAPLIESGDVTAFVNTAISLGMSKFWNARFWKFRVRPYTMTIPDESGVYVAPDDFRAVKAIAENGSQWGESITYKSSEEFTMLFPKLGAHPPGFPQIYTVEYNGTDRKYYFKFWPVPTTGIQIPMQIISKTPDNVENIDADFYGAMYAAIACYLHPLGSPGREDAEKLFAEEVQTLEQNDSCYAADDFRFLFEFDAKPRVRVRPPWA